MGEWASVGSYLRRKYRTPQRRYGSKRGMRDFSNGLRPLPKLTLAELALVVGAACGTGNLERNVMEGDENRSAWEERQFAVTVTVPDPAWQVTIEEIHVVGEELWVLSRLRRDPETMAPQVISRATDHVEVAAPDYAEKHHILGKTWSWENEDAPDNYSFPEDRADLEEALNEAERIFARD